jgi:hypothetical protein
MYRIDISTILLSGRDKLSLSELSNHFLEPKQTISTSVSKNLGIEQDLTAMAMKNSRMRGQRGYGHSSTALFGSRRCQQRPEF